MQDYKRQQLSFLLLAIAACGDNGRTYSDAYVVHDDARIVWESVVCSSNATPITPPSCPDGQPALAFDAFSAMDANCGKGTFASTAEASVRMRDCSLELSAIDPGSYESPFWASCVWALPDPTAIIVNVSMYGNDSRIGPTVDAPYVRNFGNSELRTASGERVPTDRPWLRFHSEQSSTTIEASADGANWNSYGSSPAPPSTITAYVRADASQGLTAGSGLQMLGGLFVCP